MGDMHALSVSNSCVDFGPSDCKVILKPREGYVPKVLSTPFRDQIITLSAFALSDFATGENPPLQPLCPVHALRVYVERTRQLRLSEQLFICFGGRNKGMPVSKQRLSHWIVDAIALAYSSQNVECPTGLRAHSTRGIASSYAWANGIPIEDICSAAWWASQNTFARFYNLDVSSLASRILSTQENWAQGMWPIQLAACCLLAIGCSGW